MKVPDDERGVMEDKRWRVSAPAMLTVNSIFAALAAVFIAFVLQWGQTGGWIKWSVALLSAAGFLFLLTAEKITEALDQDDVRAHVAYMLPYDLAVALLFVAVAILIVVKYTLAWYWVAILGATSWYPWLTDAKWLLFIGNDDFDKYLMQLAGKEIGDSQDRCAGLFYWFRGKLHG